MSQVKSEIKLKIAEKSDKKAIKRFYKSVNYSASFIGNDSCLLLTCSGDIVASVIVSKIEQVHFLHGLAVSPKFRHQQLATRLLRQCVNHFDHLICFASASLAPLYLNAQFTAQEKQAFLSSKVPFAVKSRYLSYHANKPELLAFLVTRNQKHQVTPKETTPNQPEQRTIRSIQHFV